MPYTNWDVQHIVLQSAPWYDVEQLLACITMMRSKNFSVQEGRNQALAELNGLHYSAPFSRTKRFPEESVYGTEAFGDWDRQFAQLKAACAYKTRAAAVAGHVPDDKERQAENDASQDFWHSTTKMFELTRATSVCNREKFQRWGHLNWQDAP